MIEETRNKLNVSVQFLCEVAGVSKSGFYNHLNSKEVRKIRNENDKKSRELILEAFNVKGYKKGARSIKMTLERDSKIIFNLKRIRRIMKKYSIVCPKRKPNLYKQIAKATHEHQTCPNSLNRDFKQGKAYRVLLTDITYLTYSNGKRAYLSAMKDSGTNEIIAFNVSDNLKVEIALNTVNILLKKQIKLDPEVLIHSDQGFHYTNPRYQALLLKNNITQSMSRRGNCWDNAPMESFFGHMKDDIFFKELESLEEVKYEVKRYMNYYNNHRCQWGLKKMTPVEYRSHLLAS